MSANDCLYFRRHAFETNRLTYTAKLTALCVRLCNKITLSPSSFCCVTGDGSTLMNLLMICRADPRFILSPHSCLSGVGLNNSTFVLYPMSQPECHGTEVPGWCPQNGHQCSRNRLPGPDLPPALGRELPACSPIPWQLAVRDFRRGEDSRMLSSPCSAADGLRPLLP